MQADFASDAGQADGKELLQSLPLQYCMIENERSITLRCSNCRKLETDDDDGNNDNREVCVLSACGNCRRAYYCSTSCQAAHWKTQHKLACKKIAKASVPEKYLTFDESIQQSHSKATAGGSCLYPVHFVVWLVERSKYSNSSSSFKTR
jgi:MYND finger